MKKLFLIGFLLNIMTFDWVGSYLGWGNGSGRMILELTTLNILGIVIMLLSRQWELTTLALIRYAMSDPMALDMINFQYNMYFAGFWSETSPAPVQLAVLILAAFTAAVSYILMQDEKASS